MCVLHYECFFIDFVIYVSGLASEQPFIHAFLFCPKQKKQSLSNRIWSRRSTLLPEFVNSSVRIYNGKLLFVLRSPKERLVINLESLLHVYKAIFKADLWALERPSVSTHLTQNYFSRKTLCLVRFLAKHVLHIMCGSTGICILVLL